MHDILNGFKDSQINDHDSHFSIDRTLRENNIFGGLFEFVGYVYDLERSPQGSKFELAIEKAGKENDVVEQLKIVITELNVSVGNFLIFYTHNNYAPIAPIFEKVLDEGKRTKFKQPIHKEVYPNVVALKIKELFFNDDPFAFEKLMDWRGEHSFQERVDWQKSYMLYGDDPFKILFEAMIEQGRSKPDDVYQRIWGKYFKDKQLLEYAQAQPKNDFVVTDMDLRQSYQDCMKQGVRWHKKLLNVGKPNEAEQWEEKLKETYNERGLSSVGEQLGDISFGEMLWQRLDSIGIDTASDESYQEWLEAAFNTGNTPYQNPKCSTETAIKFFKSSLRIIKWTRHFRTHILSKSYISDEQKFFLNSEKENLPVYWYSSPFRKEWLDCIDEHLQKVSISKKLDILSYLMSFDFFEVTDENFKEQPIEDRGPEFVDKKVKHHWASACKSIGEEFLKGKQKLGFNELITYFDLLFQRPDKFEYTYKDLVPYADKIMAFARPKLKNDEEGFDIHQCENAYKVLLSHSPEKLLRNLLHTFRASPSPCSGKTLEYGVGSDLGYKGLDEETPLHWWISIMINNCLRTPYLQLDKLKPEQFQQGQVPGKPNRYELLDMNGNKIGEDDFAQDSEGNRLDKDGNRLSGYELKKISNPLQKTFADFCFKALRLKKGERITKGKYSESQCTEPDPFWRQGFVFALSEIGLDLGGKVHGTLNFIAKHDPDEHVRKYAKKAGKSLRREKNKNSDDPVKGMLIAFWWLRLAQRNSMDEEVEGPAATRVRRNELRYAQKLNFSLLK